MIPSEASLSAATSSTRLRRASRSQVGKCFISEKNSVKRPHEIPHQCKSAEPLHIMVHLQQQIPLSQSQPVIHKRFTISCTQSSHCNPTKLSGLKYPYLTSIPNRPGNHLVHAQSLVRTIRNLNIHSG